jgi:hypothetical protein
MAEVKTINAIGDAKFQIDKSPDEIKLTLTITGLPDIVTSRIVEVGEELTGPVLEAIFTNIGAHMVDKGTITSVERTRTPIKSSVH